MYPLSFFIKSFLVLSNLRTTFSKKHNMCSSLYISVIKHNCDSVHGSSSFLNRITTNRNSCCWIFFYIVSKVFDYIWDIFTTESFKFTLEHFFLLLLIFCQSLIWIFEPNPVVVLHMTHLHKIIQTHHLNKSSLIV